MCVWVKLNVVQKRWLCVSACTSFNFTKRWFSVICFVCLFIVGTVSLGIAINSLVAAILRIFSNCHRSKRPGGPGICDPPFSAMWVSISFVFSGLRLLFPECSGCRFPTPACVLQIYTLKFGRWQMG